MKMPWLAMVVAPVVLGCRPQTDLNAKCILTKSPRYADGGVNPNAAPVPVLEREIKDGLHKDFISLIATDCDEGVCVRDADFRPANNDPDAQAEGYCSAPCVPTSPRCYPEDPADDDKPEKNLSCRALLLDEATLSAICAADPRCDESIGSTKSPYYCAHRASLAPDAGT